MKKKKKKKILMSGGNGNLGNEIYKTAKNFEVYRPKSSEMDICNPNQVEANIKKYQPNYFIHCAAFVRPMIDHQNI